jgi:hypothetical protein
MRERENMAPLVIPFTDVFTEDIGLHPGKLDRISGFAWSFLYLIQQHHEVCVIWVELFKYHSVFLLGTIGNGEVQIYFFFFS